MMSNIYVAQTNFGLLQVSIFLWRENIAKQMNIPPSHVVKDKLLKRIRNAIYKDADFYFLNDLIKNEEFTESLMDILKK